MNPFDYFNSTSPSSSSAYPHPTPPSSSTTFRIQNLHRKPRKKRLKFIHPHNLNPPQKPKPIQKPVLSAPKITDPCTECGRKFWSLKALFGHMRCHPERDWRGIIPPQNKIQNQNRSRIPLEEDDHDVAESLILLSNAPPFLTTSGLLEETFECSSCNKVFGSHQALGGHRASHKNVKGCFASARTEGMIDQQQQQQSNYHKCNICLKVFSSGQALGGHKRCHWERVEKGGLGIDLNSSPPVEDEILSLESYSCGVVSLDLRLGM